MKSYTYSEARSKFAELLEEAKTREVMIKRRNGDTFILVSKKSKKSPFDIKGIESKSTTSDILSAVKESRRG